MGFCGSSVFLFLLLLEIQTALLQATSETKETSHVLSRKKRTAPFRQFTTPRWRFPLLPSRGPTSRPFPFPPRRGRMQFPFPRPFPGRNVGVVGRMPMTRRPDFNAPIFGRRTFIPFSPFPRNPNFVPLQRRPPLPFGPRAFGPGPNGRRMDFTSGFVANPSRLPWPQNVGPRVSGMRGPMNIPTNVGAFPSFNSGHLQGPVSTNDDPRIYQIPLPTLPTHGRDIGFPSPIPHCFGAYVQHCRMLRPNEDLNNGHRCQGNCPGRTCFANCICTCELPEGQMSRSLPVPRGMGGHVSMGVVPPRVFMAQMLDGGPGHNGGFPIGLNMDGPDLGSSDTLSSVPVMSDSLMSNPGINILDRPIATKTGELSIGPVHVARLGSGLKPGLGVTAGAGMNIGVGMGTGLGIKPGLGMKAEMGIKDNLGIGTGLGIKTGLGMDAGMGVNTGLGMQIGPEPLSLSSLGIDMTGSDAFQATPLTDETLAQLLSEEDLNFLVGPSGVNSMIAGEPPILDIPVLSHGIFSLPDLGMAEINLNLPEPEMHIIRKSEADARRVAARAGVGGQGSLTFGGMIQLEDLLDVSDARRIPVGLSADVGWENALAMTSGFAQPSIQSSSDAFSSFGENLSLKSLQTLPAPIPVPSPPTVKQILPVPSPVPAPPLARVAATASPALSSQLVSINSALANTVSIVSGAQDATFGPVTRPNHTANAHALSGIPTSLSSLVSEPAFVPLMANMLGVSSDIRPFSDSPSGSADAFATKLAKTTMAGNDATADTMREPFNIALAPTKGISRTEMPISIPSELEMLVSLLGIPTPLTNYPLTRGISGLPPAHAQLSNTSGSVTNSSGHVQPNFMQSFLSGTITATDPMVEGESGESCWVQQKELWCDPAGVWDGTPGVSKWCLLNCQTDANCDRKLCACTCLGSNLFRTKYFQLASNV